MNYFQGIIEGIFMIGFIIYALYMSLNMIKHYNRDIRITGAASILLCIAYVFHGISRVLNLFTNQYNEMVLLSNMVMSIVISIFMLTIYMAYTIKNYHENYAMTVIMAILTAIRIILCLLPGNEWFGGNCSFFWIVLRNIVLFVTIVIIAYTYLTEESNEFYGTESKVLLLDAFMYFIAAVWSRYVPFFFVLMFVHSICLLVLMNNAYRDSITVWN